MDTATLIDNVIDGYDHVSSTDSDNTAREAKILLYAQEVVDEVWYFREWDFRYRSGTVTFAAGDYESDLPANFHEFGSQGLVIVQSTGAKLVADTSANIFEQSYTDTTTFPTYSVWGQNSTTGRKLLQISSSAAMTLDVFYLATSPTLSNCAGDDGQLQFIPTAYHQTVILPGVVYKVKHQQEGEDQRDWYNRYQQGLNRMVAMERAGKTRVQRLPLAVDMW